MIRAALTLSCLLLAPAPFTGVAAADTFPGPVEAMVERVIDGDTLVVRAAVWPGHTVRVSVRLRGIDAPELKSRCAAEREAARQARDALATLVAGGAVTVSGISGDKYFGRVLAEISTATGEPVAQTLLEQGLVRPYRGGRRDAPACR